MLPHCRYCLVQQTYLVDVNLSCGGSNYELPVWATSQVIEPHGSKPKTIDEHDLETLAGVLNGEPCGRDVDA